MEAFLVITILTLAASTVSGTTTELSTTTGDTVNIPCPFGEGTLRDIYWYYGVGSEAQKILYLTDEEITIAAEFANRASLQDDSATLILKYITVADEGTYRCIVDTLKQSNFFDIKTKLKVFSLRPDTPPMISPCTGADESSSCSIHANQSFTLTCTLPNVYPPEDTELIWNGDGKYCSSPHDVTPNDDGTTDISRQIQVSETGNFTCMATYRSANGRENTAVSVKSWIIPPADVPGKNMTCVDIAWKNICIALLLGIFVVIIFYVCYRLKARAQTVAVRRRSATQTSHTEELDIDLNVVAAKVPDDQFNVLGNELGFSTVEMDDYSATNPEGRNSAMLKDWDDERFETVKRQNLRKVLAKAGLSHLAVDVPNTEVPAQPQSPLNDQQIG